MKRRLYRYVAPKTSEAYFMAPDKATAAAFVMLMGNGMHTADTVDNDRSSPIIVLPAMLTCGFEEYWKADLGVANLQAWIAEHREGIAAVADTLQVCQLSEYKSLMRSLERKDDPAEISRLLRHFEISRPASRLSRDARALAKYLRSLAQ